MRAWRTAGLVVAIEWVLSTAGPTGAAAPPDSTSPPLVVYYAASDLDRAARAAVRGALDRAAQRLGAALLDLSPPDEPAAQALLHLRRAVEAYQDFRYAEALASADAALGEAAATGALGLSGADLSDLLIYRALALTERGDAARAWDDFVRAATLDPSRRLDPVRYPPRVTETFARAVAAVAAAPPATLTVALPPGGCQLWLDGRSVTGQSSLATTRGEHYLRARCPGRAPYGARVLVAGAAQRIAPEMAALAPPAPAALGAAARQRGFASAVSATLSGGGGGALLLSLRWFDATGRARAQVSARLARADSAAPIEQALGRLLAPLAPAAPGEPPAGPSPWYRSPWLWGAAGAALAAAVLIPFAIDAGTPSDFDVRPRGDVPP